jgi:hypothetical protein
MEVLSCALFPRGFWAVVSHVTDSKPIARKEDGQRVKVFVYDEKRNHPL